MAKDLSINQLSTNIYQHVSYQVVEGYGNVPANGLIYVEGSSAYIIDTPWSNADSKALLNWLKQNGFSAAGVIATHFHQDASGGLSFFNQKNIPTYASNKTNQLLIGHGRAAAKRVFTEPSELLEQSDLAVFYPGKGHAPDNIVVWLPKGKMLFGGCFVKSIKSSTLGNLSDASIDQWPDAIDNVLKKYPDIETVMPGHGAPGGIELLIHTKNLAIKKAKSVKGS